MYIDNEDFEKWMAKLSKKLTEIGQDLFLWFFFKFGGTSCFIVNKESSL